MASRHDLDLHYRYLCQRLEGLGATPLLLPSMTDVLSDGEFQALIRETAVMLIRINRAVWDS